MNPLADISRPIHYTLQTCHELLTASQGKKITKYPMSNINCNFNHVDIYLHMCLEKYLSSRYAIGNAERSTLEHKIGWLDVLANDTFQFYGKAFFYLFQLTSLCHQKQ